MERTSFLSQEELVAVQELHKNAPYAITGVSQSVFNFARHYGGMTYKDCEYTYIPEHDELVRWDVLHKLMKMRRQRTKEQQQPSKQTELDF